MMAMDKYFIVETLLSISFISTAIGRADAS